MKRQILYPLLIIGIFFSLNIFLSGHRKQLIKGHFNNLEFSQIYIIGTSESSNPYYLYTHGVYIKDFEIKNDNIEPIKTFALNYINWALKRHEIVDYVLIHNTENIDHPAENIDNKKIIAKVVITCQDGENKIYSIVLFPKVNNYQPKIISHLNINNNIPCDTLRRKLIKE